MKDTKKPSKTVASAINNHCAELVVLVAGGGAKVKIEGKDSVIAFRPRHGKSKVVIPFVDTNVIPDRNAGIGSLLRDLQNPEDLDRYGPPLLDPKFAFIDVGVSRARVAIALKTLLARDLKMDVDYVSTELPEAVPYANVTVLEDWAEKVRAYLSGMSPSKKTTYDITDWHFVVDRTGKVSSVAYSYQLYGNEMWEAYFMGRTFMYTGEEVDFSDPKLNEMLATDVQKIESRIELERKRNGDPSQPGPSWDGYRMEKNPLQSGLLEFGITLQTTDVPHRIKDRQNVLFLGNILNHYPQDVRAFELDRISANMEAGDIIIIQMDGIEPPTIEVLQVKGPGDRKTRVRVRWINTNKLEIQKPFRGPGSCQQINVKPAVDWMVIRLIECLGRKVNSREWNQKDHRVLVHQTISHVFRTFFRALPVAEILRIAIREALRRLPSEGGPKGIPVFKDDTKDAYGGELGLDPSPIDSSPIVSESDLINMKLAAANVERTQSAETQLSNRTGIRNQNEQFTKN